MINIDPVTLDSETITAMRGWISDCTWDDLDDDEIAELPETVIIRGVQRHYSGGVAQFLADKD